MIKLMKLEMAKMKLGWYTKASVLANVLIVLFMIMICYIEKTEGRSAVSDMNELYIVTGAFVRATFVVMGSVLLSRLVIEEYKNKTIFVMFMYPISRKKLIASKLAIVALLTLISTALSYVFTLGAFTLINRYLDIIPAAAETPDYTAWLASIATNAVATAGMSLIPLYFGMRKHSVPATIISSLLIVAITSSHNPVISLASLIYIPIGFAVVGVAIAWWSIRGIDKADVL